MCPPGTDQTTRTAQRWTLLAPKLQQRQGLFSHLEDSWEKRRYGPLDFCYDKLCFGAFEKLYKSPPSSAIISQLCQPFKPSQHTSSISILENLPPELIGNIFSVLEPDELVALGLCSQKLWVQAVRAIHDRYHNCSGVWAGTPIVCTGTYLQDLPQTIYDLFPSIEKDTKAWGDVHGQGVPMRGMAPARRWNWNALSAYAKVVKSADLEQEFQDALSKHLVDSHTPQRLHSAMRSCIGATNPVRGDVEPQWYFRNFNTKEFLRMETKDGDTSNQTTNLFVEGNPYLTLDLILIWRIVWTCQGAYGREKAELEAMKRGKWAGHCFDVVTSEWPNKDSDWEDITVKLAKESLAWKTTVGTGNSYTGL